MHVRLPAHRLNEDDFPFDSTGIIEAQVIGTQSHHDFIISNQLMSMLFAQISEEPDILRVYDQIFDDDGSEIYLKPLTLYFDQFPIQVSFADLMAIVQNRGATCLGIKRASYENNPDKNYGVTLIPEKNTKYELTAEDHLVVLAEDEF